MASFDLATNVRQKSGWILTFGILQVVLGIMAMTFVGLTSLFSVLYLGIILMVSGVFEIVYAVKTREHGGLWFHLLFGILATVCGYFVFTNPIENLVLLTVLIATLFIVTGAVNLIGSLVERFPNWGWFAFEGAVSIAAGYLVFSNPLTSSIWLIGFMVGLQMIFRGAAWISLGVMGRSLTKHRTATA